MKRTPPIERLLRRCIEDDNGCWLWQGATNGDGYVRIGMGGTADGDAQGHRVAYEYFRAEIPAGLVIDHLCRVPRCVNPWHLEPVTNRVNTMRGNAMKNGEHNRVKTHCKYGHEYTPENVVMTGVNSRSCLQCKRDYAREAMRNLRARRMAS